MKGILKNSVDLDQMQQTTASDQSLHCKHTIQIFFVKKNKNKNNQNKLDAP